MGSASRCGQQWLLFMGLLFILLYTTGASSQEIALGDYVAFSLREAEILAKDQKTGSPGLKNLAGMTRIVGLVHDTHGRDLIIVGKKAADLPIASMDDLVVALRSRLVEAVWPMVSIDPTEETAMTRKQAVRFKGGIENTKFGNDFLECDIVLKNYSLGKVTAVPKVANYKDLFDRDIQTELAAAGGKIVRATWQVYQESGQEVRKFQNRQIKEQKVRKCRFWFYPRDESQVAELEGLLVIPELHLGVRREVTEEKGEKAAQDQAADDFAAQFTENLPAMAAQYPVLKRMSLLYALVSVAEGIGRLPEHLALNYFLYDYPVEKVGTARYCDLQEIFGVFQQDHAINYITRISGGLELKAWIRKLNAGDVSALKDAVLKSRPSPTSLYWCLPLQGWRLPGEVPANPGADDDLSVGQADGVRQGQPGCSVVAQSYLLGPPNVMETHIEKKFTGFPAPSYFPPLPLQSPKMIYSSTMPQSDKPVGGVHMDPKPQKQGAGGEAVKKSTLNSRPSEDSLSWPIPKAKGGKE